MKKIRSIIIILASAVLMFSCSEEYLDTTPTDAVSADMIFQTTQGANVALNGIYRWFYWYHGVGHDDFSYKALDIKCDLMGNDMKVFSEGYGWFIFEYKYIDRGNPGDETTTWIAWKLNYEVIFNANIILSKIDDAVGPLEEKNAIKGQAYALRAYAYFNLAQWYGPTFVGNQAEPCVPIKVLPDEVHAPIASVGEVFNQAKSDIAEAVRFYNEPGTVDREAKSQVDISVALGIQARIALVMNEWDLAISAAQGARTAHYGDAVEQPLMSTDDYQAGFKDVENGEWMWGMDVNNEQATIYASFFSHMDPIKFSYASLGLQKQVTVNMYDNIPDTDVRKSVVVSPQNEIDSIIWAETGQLVPAYSSYKFSTGGSWASDYVLMRAAEMYLIEAEAASEIGLDAAAQVALNAILEARDPGTTTSNTGQALKDEIYWQRTLELWGEGIGLFDLKRKNMPLARVGHDPTLCVETDIPAGDYRFSLRIPQWEIDANDNISEADQRD
ncbi:MAG: RagB/SusD family nutrient uptake outer membrane protein [Bacteroidetes bacterium]|nr:RagB/SusD family nutrient uptake outer membrane protein [Bacteroidota bacterium]